MTSDDREWIAAQLGEMERRYHQNLEGTERRLDAKFEGIGRELAEMRREFDAKLERVETTLLTEFHKWANPTEQRIKNYAVAMRAIYLELEEYRLADLEPPSLPH